MGKASLLTTAALAALIACITPSLALWDIEVEIPAGDVPPQTRPSRPPPPPLLPVSAKNIIIMVGDGMGLSDVTAARIYRHGLDGAGLSFETLDYVGYERTYSANSVITDSAAAASAWGCGEKFDNGVICVRADGSHPISIAERAKRLGKSVGLVATSTITHATPAGFAAHVPDRGCEQEIARQYIETAHVDVLLGGGEDMFHALSPDACGGAGNFVVEAVAAGYAVAYTKADLDLAVSQGATKALGLFTPGHMTPEIERPPDTTEPHLAETAAAALTILDRNPLGFFVLIEGSQIDFANHANNYDYQLGEMLGFDDAVAAVKSWIDASPTRRSNTLLIVVADHETGGHAIVGPYGSLVQAGQQIESGWVTGSHTGVDTLIWSQGPSASRLARGINNTDVYKVMLQTLR